MVTSAVFCWSHRPILIQCRKGLYKGVDTKRWESLGAVLEIGYNRWSVGKGEMIHFLWSP